MDEQVERLRGAEAANELHRTVEVRPDVVRRPAGPGTETVHSLLRHLRAQGLTCVPEPLGVQDGVETLGFLDGLGGGDGWFAQHTDDGVASASRLLRTIHDATVGWRPPDNAVWGAPAVAGGDIVYCHGDPGPWNFIWHDHDAVALIDWDYLHPAPRLDDVAYALLWFAPFRSDTFALQWQHFPEVPDRRRRVQVFLDAYRDLPAVDVVAVVSARIQGTSDAVRALAERGQEPQRTWVADGALPGFAQEIRWIDAHRFLFE